MQTRTDSFVPATNWLSPFGSWEAAARWNSMAYEWLTRGWQQWVELVTVWPALEPKPQPAQPEGSAPAGTQQARNARTVREQAQAAEVRPRRVAAAREARPTASASAKRAAPKRPARTKAARPTRSRG